MIGLPRSASFRHSPLRWARPVAVALLGILLAGCMAQSVVVVGEAPVPPPGRVPMVAVQVQDDLGVPIIGARAKVSGNRLVTDDSGVIQVRWEGVPFSVSVEAEGFFPGAVAVEAFQKNPLELMLRPVVLRGTVVDGNGFGLSAASVSLGDREVMTDQTGRFEISRPSVGTIRVSRPGWHDTALYWDGEFLVTNIKIKPRVIRGLHVAYSVHTDPEQWEELLAIADETVVNSLVIDVKDESGRVLYDTQVALANQLGAADRLFDLDRVVAEMDRRGLYKIARIVTFQDPIAARLREDMAAYDTATESPYRKGKQYFLDPTDRQARAYALDLADEVCSAGFDEIQFDYVRFPDGFPETVRFDLDSSAEVRKKAITGFLQEAVDRLHPLGCLVAADIFGFITSVADDGGIGQEFASLSAAVDVISPMVYPSHYSKGWFGFDKPNDHPGEVVGSALAHGMKRLEGAAIIRPWLQDFYYDDPSQVRAEIDAAEDLELGWMLWNARSRFKVGALEAEPPAAIPPEGDGDSGASTGPAPGS